MARTTRFDPESNDTWEDHVPLSELHKVKLPKGKKGGADRQRASHALAYAVDRFIGKGSN
jgi:hypothetical protein